MSTEDILDEGFQFIVSVGDDIDASNENYSNTGTGDIGGKAGSGEMSGLCSIPGISPLSLENGEDMWLT